MASNVRKITSQNLVENNFQTRLDSLFALTAIEIFFVTSKLMGGLARSANSSSAAAAQYNRSGMRESRDLAYVQKSVNNFRCCGYKSVN